MLDLFRVQKVRAAIAVIGVLSLFPSTPVAGELADEMSCLAQTPSRPHGCRVSTVPFWGSLLAEVRWTDTSSNEDGFTVEWWAQNSTTGAWYLIETIAPSPDSTSALMRFHAGRNRYRVRAFNRAGASAWSNWASLTYP